jgi:hypothetical protein
MRSEAPRGTGESFEQVKSIVRFRGDFLEMRAPGEMLVEDKAEIRYLFGGSDRILLDCEGEAGGITLDSGTAVGRKENDSLCFI